MLHISGLLFLVGALRIHKLPEAEEDGAKSLSQNIRTLEWKPRALSLRFNAE